MFCLVELAKFVEMSAQKRMTDVSVFFSRRDNILTSTISGECKRRPGKKNK